MKITIKDNTFDLIYSIRTNIMYENVIGKSLDYSKLSNVSEATQLFYCNILASMQANKLPLEFGWDEFIEWLDANGGYVFLNDYALWLAKQLEIQAHLIGKQPEKKESSEKKKVKKTQK